MRNLKFVRLCVHYYSRINVSGPALMSEVRTARESMYATSVCVCNQSGGKVHPRTGHEGPVGSRVIAILFL